MSDANALDAAALGPYLEQHVARLCRPRGHRKIQLRPIQPDLSASRPRAAATCCAPSRPAQLLKSAHQVDREFRVMKALAGSGVPVPEGPAPLRRGRADRPHVLRHGASSTAASSGIRRCRRSVDNAERAAIYDAMNATLAALHDVDVAARRPRRFRQAGQLFRAPARPLDRASTGPPRPGRSPTWTRLIAWLGEQHAGRRRPGLAGAWRFPAGQHDLRHRTRRT